MKPVNPSIKKRQCILTWYREEQTKQGRKNPGNRERGAEREKKPGHPKVLAKEKDRERAKAASEWAIRMMDASSWGGIVAPPFRLLLRGPGLLFPLHLLLLLPHLGEHHLAEDGPLGQIAQGLLLPRGASRQPGTGRIFVGERLPSHFLRVGRYVRLAQGAVFVVRVLHFQRLDPVGEFDDVDAALETGLGHDGAELGQQIEVGGRLAGQPDVLEGFFARESLAGVGLQQADDEIFGVRADVFPVPAVEDDAPALAFFDQIRDVFAAEGRVAT